MDARGFAMLTCRTSARPQPFTDRDRVLLLAAAVASIGTVVLGEVLGTWRSLLGQG
jgi:energy-coupling factor transporter transmembrane protein EcfT